jgi:hypothetical protein
MPSRTIHWALAALLAALALAPALAQQPSQPYTGLQARPIRALSADEMADLSSGRGMGLALPAEMNGYPGPLHVLELADRLGLTEEQRASVGQQLDRMRAEAVPLGQRLIAAERELDREFAERTITPERLKAATEHIADIRGELRNTHLRYHLLTAAILGADQIRRYAQERGYAPGGSPGAHAGSIHPPASHEAADHGKHHHTAPQH